MNVIWERITDLMLIIWTPLVSTWKISYNLTEIGKWLNCMGYSNFKCCNHGGGNDAKGRWLCPGFNIYEDRGISGAKVGEEGLTVDRERLCRTCLPTSAS